MPRMRAPYTGVVFDVRPGNVEKRLARGFELLEPYDLAEPEPETGEPEDEQEPEDDGAGCDSPRPTENSTVAEIREWAAAHGVELPRRATKAQMLAAIEGAV